MISLVSFNHTDVKLVGGYRIKIDGTLQGSKGGLTFLQGINGSGKTTVLSAASFVLGFSGFGNVESVEETNTQVASEYKWRKFGFVRQDPYANFSGGCVADEIVIPYLNAAKTQEEIRAELAELLSTAIDCPIDMMEKKCRHLSSGQAQSLATAISSSNGARVLFLDEPFARLSRRNARKLAHLLHELAHDTLVICAIHPLDSAAELILTPEKLVQVVERDGGLIEITKPTTLVPEISKPITLEQIEKVVERFRVSKPLLLEEQRRSNNFLEIPENTVRMLAGGGPSLLEEAVDLTIRNAKTDIPLVAIHKCDIHEGTNILIGDNGAGKTLICSCIAGEVPSKDGFRVTRGGLDFDGKRLRARPCFNKGLQHGTMNLASVFNMGNGVFLRAEPMKWLGEQSVLSELGSILSGSELDAALAWLESVGIHRDAKLRALSFGQQRLTAFASLPQTMECVILDEPFASLSSENKRLLAQRLSVRIISGDWRSVIVTTNRPDELLCALSNF